MQKLALIVGEALWMFAIKGCVLRGLFLAAALVAGSVSPAFAGFQSWTADINKDPFSGGVRVTADYMISMRSGVIVICNTSEVGLLVRAVPGFAFSAELQGFTPTIEFAIDGNRLFGQAGETGSVGDNLAIAQTKLDHDHAETFVKAFASARQQIAIKDGISDRPYLMSARGSTRAGGALVKCMEKQSP